MKISKDEVERVAKLARLIISEEELDQLTGELDSILEYIEKLKEINTEGIRPTTHASAVFNAFREDIVCESLELDDVLLNASEKEGQMFKVPKII